MRSSSAQMFDVDEPALRFEEAHRNTPAAPSSHASSTVSDSRDHDPYSSLKRKQEELLKIRQQLEKTERETSHLETLRVKEDRFDTGRREMIEKLSRSLGKLERDLYNFQKAIEEITTARDLYQRHLDVMQSMKPEGWQRGNLDADLERSIAAIDDAEDEFGKVSRRLASVLPGEQSAEYHSPSSTALPQNFTSWMRCGLAFTLPLIVALALYLIVSHFTH